jgi:cytochrome c-type biogenesis protein CcmF
VIAELGHFALALALVIAFAADRAAARRRGNAGRAADGRGRVAAGNARDRGAFGCLMWSTANDTSVLNVVQNSHSAKPMLYKITGPGETTRARCCSGC